MADRTNIADGDDRVAIQVGHVGGRSQRGQRDQRQDDGPTTVENVREGNAQVGAQVDRVDGPLNIRR